MADINTAIRDGILGDIRPIPSAREHLPGGHGHCDEPDLEDEHPGTRELSEGGGVNAEVSGTRNYHSTGGATGGDLGNRPEQRIT